MCSKAPEFTVQDLTLLDVTMKHALGYFLAIEVELVADEVV